MEATLAKLQKNYGEKKWRVSAKFYFFDVNVEKYEKIKYVKITECELEFD